VDRPPEAAFERLLDVEVTVNGARAGDHPPRAAATRRPDPRQRRQQPPGQASRVPPQGRIGGDGEIGQHRDGSAPIPRHLHPERGDVEYAHLGRDLLEARVGGAEALPIERPASVAVDLLAGVLGA
jgi:hypothetical protein